MARFYINFVSDSVKDAMDVCVIVPQKKHVRRHDTPDLYLGSFSTQYPLLMLLHDEASSPNELLDMSRIERYAEENHLMVVLPTGLLSYYTDYAERDSSINSANASGAARIESNFTEMCYEAYVLDVMDYMCRLFPVSPDREKHYIGGIGMGGFGALKITMKYPERFSAVFTISGDVDLQWKMDHEYWREAQFVSIFGGLRAEGENDLPGACQRVAEGTQAPRLMVIWNRSDERSAANASVCDRLRGVYPKFREEVFESDHPWDYIDDAFLQAVKWLNTLS